MPPVNLPGVLLCTVLIFFLGALWYSPVMFGNVWLRLQGKTAEELAENGGAMPLKYAQVFVCAFLTAWAIGVVLHHTSYSLVLTGIKLAGVWWLGLAAATSYATALFSGKPRGVWLIDTTFNLVSFVMTGIILSLWR